MKNTHLAKTLTASLPGNVQEMFARISDPDNLPNWHTSFCRSLRKDNGSLIVESPRGDFAVHFMRDDHSHVLDIVVRIGEGVTLTHAIRLIPNGEGSEMIWTLVKPQGLADTIFHEHLRWAGSALQNLRKAPALNILPKAEDRTSSIPKSLSGITETGEAVEPLQAPSAAEVSSMPQSGKKLFVGNLPYDWTDDQLRAHFAEQGTILLAEVARFRGRGGRSRGFGFIEMSSEAEAQLSIEKLHGSPAGGRQIIVRIAKSQESRPSQNPRSAKPDVRSPSEKPASDGERETSDPDLPQPGNERAPRTSGARPRTERPRRGGMGRSRDRSAAPRGPRPSSPGSGHSYPQDISNKSGYEIFPRRAPGSTEPVRSSAPDSPPSRPHREASPYMEDTGDIENRGRRAPRHRSRG